MVGQSQSAERQHIEGRSFVHNLQAGKLLEDFFVAAVAAVLIIRFYLFFIAYRHLIHHAPFTGQVLVGPFHFAHMLWGGLLMLAGFVVILTFLGRSAKSFGAIIGGIGFGAFIDELGKIITLHNDYFYQPALAIIYIAFVVLFLVLRFLQRPRSVSARTALVNALEYVQQAVLHDFHPDERARMITLLEQQDSGHPFVPPLRRIVTHVHDAPPRRPDPVARGRDFIRRAYAWFVHKTWFPYVVVSLFVVHSISGLYQTMLRVIWSEFLAGMLIIGTTGVLLFSLTWHPSTRTLRTMGILFIAVVLSWGIVLHLEQRPVSIVHWIQLIAPLVSAVLVMFGALLIGHARLEAYRLFHLALLVSILITQVFAFYQAQILAVIGLLLQLLTLAVLRFMIEREETATATSAVSRPHTQGSRHGLRTETRPPC